MLLSDPEETMMRISGIFLTMLVITACAPLDRETSAKLDAQAKEITELRATITTIAATATSRPGRFQVINGTPQFARNIMLIDSETGRTWLTCETKDKTSVVSTGWCAIDFYGDAVGPIKP